MSEYETIPMVTTGVPTLVPARARTQLLHLPRSKAVDVIFEDIRLTVSTGSVFNKRPNLRGIRVTCSAFSFPHDLLSVDKFLTSNIMSLITGHGYFIKNLHVVRISEILNSTGYSQGKTKVKNRMSLQNSKVQGYLELNAWQKTGQEIKEVGRNQ
ncbi:hypothetical protein J6590_040026 [Homalodisca vitripennis]|nr:hypothetical protein J6590_040026 [Homalodisca vitripennis]